MRFSPLLLLVVLAVLVAGCGGGGGSAKVDASDVATVDSAHVTVGMFDDAVTEEKASLKAAGQTVPAAGSTAYTTLRTNVVNLLVQQAEFGLEAQKLGITVTPAEVQTKLTALKKKYFGGDNAKYMKGLKQEGFTDAQVRANLKENLLTNKLFVKVTKTSKVTAGAIRQYYETNISQYKTQSTRSVREILAGKNKQALATQIYTQLKGGASFAALAKKYSQDPGSKNTGGIFTATDGNDVPEFDAAVFATTAKKSELLKPVKTAQYGWFVIQILGDIVPGKTTTEAKAAPAIRKQLNATAAQTAINAWAKGVATKYCSGSKIAYQSGYAPTPDPCATLKTPEATTT